MPTTRAHNRRGGRRRESSGGGVLVLVISSSNTHGAAPARCGQTHSAGARSRRSSAGSPLQLRSPAVPIWRLRPGLRYRSTWRLGRRTAHGSWLVPTPTTRRARFADRRPGAGRILRFILGLLSWGAIDVVCPSYRQPDCPGPVWGDGSARAAQKKWGGSV
jgi:hypothetical protein